MRRLLPVLLILLVITAIRPAAAQSEGFFAPGAHLRFEHLGIDDGLSQSAGLALLQDRTGYLWIGTQDGLNRYDGYTITQYKHDPENPATLSHNSIIALYEDRQGLLWVGTWGGGLNRYDPASGLFTRYLPDPHDPASLGHAIVTAITEDEAGDLWVGTLGGLERLDRETGAFSHFSHDPNDPTSLSSSAISVLLPAPGGKLWVGSGAYSVSGAGLNLFDPASGTAQRFEASGKCLASPNISEILPAGDGGLWIAYGGYGVSGGGLDHYQPSGGACRHWDGESSRTNQITDNNLTGLLLDHTGALWAASWSGGVWRLAPGEPGQVTVIRHQPGDPESLSGDNTYSLLQDRSGNIWIGTLSAGLNKLNLSTLQFRSYRSDPQNPNSLPSNHVGAFAQTGDGAIWVGAWEAGLTRFDPATGAFTRYQNDPHNPNSIASDLIMSLLADPGGSLWVGTLGGGLDHFDPASGVFTHHQNDPSDPASLLENQVTALLHDPAGRLWVGNFAGLSRLDPGAPGFVNYPLPAPAVSLQVVGDELWIGSWGGGLFRLDLADPANLDPARASFANLQHDPSDPNSLSENGVWVIHPGAGGEVWLGTQGGLNRFDPQTGQFTVYNEKNGLRNSSILGILEDAHGLLWLSTNNGLAKFDPGSESVQVYDKSDGLQGNEFNSNAYFQAQNGDFYFGGVDGFSVFNPLNLAAPAPPPPVVIGGFSIFSTPQAFDPSGQAPIRLNYDQNFIAFEFAALDFKAPHKNQYAYKLEGIDKDWVQAGTRNYASYTNLPGGEYTFRVRAANSDGVWNETGAALRLKVIPPFWQTWPFQVGLLLALGALITAGTQWRMRAVRSQNARLQQIITDQQRAENELRQSEARFRAAFESSAIGMGLMSLDGDILAVNAAVCEMSGYSEEELVHRNDRLNVYPPDAQVGMEQFAEMLAGEIPHYSVERRYVRKNGEVFWTRLTLSLVRDAAGAPAYLVGQIEDIDEQKRTLAELQETEARFRAMYENAAVGVALMTLDRRIVQVNPTTERLTGYTQQEITQINPSDMVVDADRYFDQALFLELIEGQRSQYLVEKRYLRKNGEIFWGRVNFALVRGEQGKPLYIVGIIEDITEEKLAAERLAAQEAGHRQQLEQRIAERTQELNLANELLREKAAQDAVTAERTRLARDLHDAVTQTLFSTTLIADVLPDIWAMNPAEGRRRLEEVRQLTRAALAEMRTLLVELRPNALVEAPLPALLRQLGEALAGRARIQIEFSAEGERRLPGDVQVGLYRIAQEALNNVVKHAGASQAVVTLRLGETVRLSVADNGAGFDPAGVTSDHLGLKIMRERAEAIGAKLSISSEPGEGTQISVVWQSGEVHGRENTHHAGG